MRRTLGTPVQNVLDTGNILTKGVFGKGTSLFLSLTHFVGD